MKMTARLLTAAKLRGEIKSEGEGVEVGDGGVVLSDGDGLSFPGSKVVDGKAGELDAVIKVHAAAVGQGGTVPSSAHGQEVVP